MKKIILIAVICLAGIGLFSYPYLSNYLAEKNASYVIRDYTEKMQTTDQSAVEAAKKEAIKYNENLSGNPVHDPFVPGSGMVMQDNYYDVLSLYDSMGYIDIPKIGVQIPIYHGTSENVLQKGIGHLEGSSLPIGGRGTHSILTGHTGLVHAKLFTDLTMLEKGDKFFIYVLDEIIAYEVDDIRVVDPKETQGLKRIKEQDYCTLITCTPYGINSHRLLVRGTRIEYTPEVLEQEAAEYGGMSEEEKMLLIAGGTALVIMILVILFVAKKKPKNKEQEKTDAIDDKTKE